LAITEIPAEEWGKLRPLLETTGLIQVETLSNIRFPYLQFHPSLTTALQSDNEDLRHRHQRKYYELLHDLYVADIQNPVEIRAIVKRELPNLFFAVKGALAEPTDYTLEFLEFMSKFLYCFGLQCDWEQLNQQAAKLAGEVGSQNWYSSKHSFGQQLFDAGHYTKATNIFTDILTCLATTLSYNRCVTLGNLGRCFIQQGKTKQAITYYQQALEIALQLKQDKKVKLQTGLLYSDLGILLTNIGRYADAQSALEQGLVIVQETGDSRGETVIQGGLGSLAIAQGNLAEAEQRYQTALAIFQRFNEPRSEAAMWHQLGVVYEEAKQWKAAEHAYRQAANIDETQGNLAGAAQTWNNLAMVMENMGKLADAEAWYRKAIEVDKQLNNPKEVAMDLSYLAALLQNQPDRLPEAQQLAEKALAIKKTLDPATTTIWTTYDILADIADKQGNAQEAKKNRRLAREAKANFAGTRYELKQKRSELILAVARGENVEAALKDYGEYWKNLKTTIQQILAGERDMEKLCEPLTFDDAPIITAILEGIAQPESLEWFEQDLTD
jgi:tetratricopeptide (TPR) repeat protein